MNCLWHLARTRGIWLQARPRRSVCGSRGIGGWGTKTTLDEADPDENEDGSRRGKFRTIILPNGSMPNPKTTALCVEVIGARQLMSSNIWGRLNPLVTLTIRLLMQLWGQPFYFTYNPLGTLEIIVMDKQFMHSEEIGRVRLSTEAIGQGLRNAWQQGEKTWKTYFTLIGGEWATEPHRPGTSERSAWHEKKDLHSEDTKDHPEKSEKKEGDDLLTHTTKEDDRIAPMGMYGHRKLALPRVRGRLYITFSLVEWENQGTNERPTFILPQPLQWPAAPGTHSARDKRREKEEQWDADQRTNREHAVFRILALDGGGVRGLLSAALVERLCKMFPDLMSQVDIVCGTSTGGLLALLLASGYTPEQSKSIYRYHLPQVFSTTPARRYSLFNASYLKKGLADVGDIYFSTRTLGDLEKHVLVTSFKVDGKITDATPDEECDTLFGPRKSAPGPLIAGSGKRWHPVVFSNIPRGRCDLGPDYNLMAKEAALRTSAAPTFFPLHAGYTDGAIFANNPSLVGVAKVKAHFPMLKTVNIRVLSIGTGAYPYSIDLQGDSDADWGLRQWGPHLVDMLSDASSVNVDMNLRLLLGANYHRLDPPLPWKIALDNFQLPSFGPTIAFEVDALDELIQLSEKADLSETEEFMKTRWLSTDPPPFKNTSGLGIV